MFKNIIRIVGIIIGCVTIIFSPYACAETERVHVELECSKNPIIAPWFIYPGEPGVQYTLTTNGLRVDMKDCITEVVEVGGLGRTRDGLYVMRWTHPFFPNIV